MNKELFGRGSTGITSLKFKFDLLCFFVRTFRIFYSQRLKKKGPLIPFKKVKELRIYMKVTKDIYLGKIGRNTPEILFGAST